MIIITCWVSIFQLFTPQRGFFFFIHALRVEDDLTVTDVGIINDAFLSTPSEWRATAGANGTVADGEISIHAFSKGD